MNGWRSVRERWRRLGAKRRPILALLVFVAHAAGALTSVRAVMEVRTSQGAIAWAVSLNTLPYVAVPAYWVFGRSRFHGYVAEIRKDVAASDAETRAVLQRLAERGMIAFPDRNEALVVEKLAKLPFTQRNSAELLIDGEATYRSVFEGIGRARQYVLVQYYIIRDDDSGRELKRRLIERARAGVRCHVLYDEVGSKDLPRAYRDELRGAGVEIAAFNSTQGESNRFQLNFRNHRKIVVVDGREAWVGGLNIGDEYLGKDPAIGPWRDTHLHLAGPVVQCVQVPFVEDWHWAVRAFPRVNWDPQPAPSGESVPVLCLPSGPADKMETCTLFFVHLINRAQKRLWIASPYFVPDEQFISALKLAAMRGVDVRILIPDRTDNALVQFTGWSYLGELEAAGIPVWRHTKGFMHQKVVLMDDLCTIGTANFDNRSFRLNFELTMEMADTAFTRQVESMLLRDFADARRCRASEVEQRGFWFRLATRVCRLMAPVQ